MIRICANPNCQNITTTHYEGFCDACRQYQNRTGNPRPRRLCLKPKRQKRILTYYLNKKCKVCEKPVSDQSQFTNQMCKTHYNINLRVPDLCDCGQPRNHLLKVRFLGENGLYKPWNLIPLCDECNEMEKEMERHYA